MLHITQRHLRCGRWADGGFGCPVFPGVGRLITLSLPQARPGPHASPLPSESALQTSVVACAHSALPTRSMSRRDSRQIR